MLFGCDLLNTPVSLTYEPIDGVSALASVHKITIITHKIIDVSTL